MDVVGDRVWNNLGVFSGSMCAGCLAGIVACTANMQSFHFFYESGNPRISHRQHFQYRANSNRFQALFFFFIPIENLCIIVAMNMLLRRVSDHASHRSPVFVHLCNRESLTMLQLLQ